MTSPFDPNYKSQDVSDIKKASRISAASSRRRARDLESDDPEVVRRATGFVGPLSNPGRSPEFVKGRKKGGR